MFLVIPFLCSLLTSVSSSDSVALVGSSPTYNTKLIMCDSEYQIPYLFGKSFLDLYSRRPIKFEDPRIQRLSDGIAFGLLGFGTAGNVLGELRDLERTLYDFFLANPDVDAEFLAKLVFPCSKYKLRLGKEDPFILALKGSFVSRLDGVKYFSILKLYYEMMLHSGRCKTWIPFDETVGDGMIETGPFATLPYDLFQLITIHCLELVPHAVKKLSLVCKQFHNLNLMNMALTRLDAKAAARMLILTYSSVNEGQISCPIFTFMKTKDWIFMSHRADDVFVELLSERECKFVPFLLDLFKDDEMVRMIPLLMNTPKRAVIMLESLPRVAERANEMFGRLLNDLFGKPFIWHYLREEAKEGCVKKPVTEAIRKLFETRKIIRHKLKPEIRILLKSCDFDASFEQYLPLFIFPSN